MKRARLVGVCCCVLVVGCAGVPPAQVGQTAGSIAGAAIAPGIGAPIGAVIGLLAGMVVQGQVDKVTEKRERRELSHELGAKATSTAESGAPRQGEPVRVWVDETFQDGRLTPAHFDVQYPHA